MGVCATSTGVGPSSIASIRRRERWSLSAGGSAPCRGRGTRELRVFKTIVSRQSSIVNRQSMDGSRDRADRAKTAGNSPSPPERAVARHGEPRSPPDRTGSCTHVTNPFCGRHMYTAHTVSAPLPGGSQRSARWHPSWWHGRDFRLVPAAIQRTLWSRCSPTAARTVPCRDSTCKQYTHTHSTTAKAFKTGGRSRRML